MRVRAKEIADEMDKTGAASSMNYQVHPLTNYWCNLGEIALSKWLTAENVPHLKFTNKNNIKWRKGADDYDIKIGNSLIDVCTTGKGYFAKMLISEKKRKKDDMDYFAFTVVQDEDGYVDLIGCCSQEQRRALDVVERNMYLPCRMMPVDDMLPIEHLKSLK